MALCVCAGVGICMLPMRAHVEIKGGHQMPSIAPHTFYYFSENFIQCILFISTWPSYPLNLIFWDRVSNWTLAISVRPISPWTRLSLLASAGINDVHAVPGFYHLRSLCLSGKTVPISDFFFFLKVSLCSPYWLQMCNCSACLPVLVLEMWA